MRYPLQDLCHYLERTVVSHIGIGRRVKLLMVRIYMKDRQRYVLFDLSESDLSRDIPRTSSSLSYVVIFLNSNVSYFDIIETNEI